MITERDLVQLPFARDLTEAGLVYAREVLLHSQEAASSTAYNSVRRIAASAALGIGFRRYLGERGLSFGVERPAPFSDPDRYDLRLGDRVCELKGYLISRAPQWHALSNDGRLALEAPALVPLDRHTRETVRGRDAYVFGFVGAQVASQQTDDERAGALTSEYWMHVMPRSWRLSHGQAALDPVILKAESDMAGPIELGGMDRSGSPVGISVQLVAGERLELPGPLLTLTHVCSRARPFGRVGIRSAARSLTHVIRSGDWQDVWLEGWGMMLLGWISREEFRTRARLIPQGRRVFQFDRTRTRNLAVAVSALRPIADLVEGPGLPGRTS